MSKTRRDLLDKALQNLGVLASGQTAANEDLARVDGFVETTIADLLARDIYYVPDPTEIDDAIFEDLALCLANNARHSFGLGSDPALPASVKGASGAESNLRDKSAEGPTYQTLKTVYF